MILQIRENRGVKIVKKILVVFISISLALMGCASSTGGGGIQADIVNGATAVDTDISGLQGQQADSASDAQAITDTSDKIAGSIDTAISQLNDGEGADSEFASIIQQVQNRQSINYSVPIGDDSRQDGSGAKDKESAQ